MNELEAREMDDLLARVHTGRLGVWTGEQVYVVPVGFVWLDGSIWFHSAEGAKTRALLDHPECCFEVDVYDEATADWTSVILWGHARPESSPAAWGAMLTRFGHVLHRVVSSGARGHLWRIEITRRTGRRGP